MCNNRKKLSIDEQLEYLKNKKGVKFNIINENTAKEYLENKTYFFKIKSFAKNYDKYKIGENEGKYINLEFAYLVELSTLDMLLRKQVLNITLDIEHYLKAKILLDITKNDTEDGYSIVDNFFNAYENIQINIKRHIGSYNEDLVNKYYTNMAVWNLIEILSFGDFIELYKFYYNQYDNNDIYLPFLLPIKCLRNAAAHNNCLLNSLKRPYNKKITENKKIITFIARNLPSISLIERKSKMSNPLMHDLIVTLYVYDSIIKSIKTKKRTFKSLKELLNGRFTENEIYFKNNDIIKSYYTFFKKFIDYFNY